MRFHNTGSGLMRRRSELGRGFVFVHPDGMMMQRDMYIEGDFIAFKMPMMTGTLYYGWADNPEATIVNSAGLPLLPFKVEFP